MRVVVRPVRHQAQHGTGQAIRRAHLGHGSAFHFHGQRPWQLRQQRGCLGRRRDEAVPADHQALMHRRLLQAKSRGRCRRGLHHRLGRCSQGCAQGGVGGQLVHAQVGYLVAWAQGRGIQVVLHQGACQHHVTHLHPGAQAAGHPRKQQAPHAEALDQQCGRQRRGHLAHAAEREHHLVPLQMAAVQAPPRHFRGLRCLHHLQNGRQLFGQGADDAQQPGGLSMPSMTSGHSRPSTRSNPHGAHARACPRHPRNSRRRILPTGVLGSSWRNSTTLGRL